MNEQERKQIIKQAKDLRFPVALLEEAALPNKVVLDSEMMELWQQHVDLLKQVYHEPIPEDKIKVEILEYYPGSRRVLQTSFSDISSYVLAYDELGWPYKLDSADIQTCHYCQEHYCTDEGEELEDEEGMPISFCNVECLENYQIKQGEENDHLEYMAECFPDQYERVDGKVRPKAPSPELQKAFREAWERRIEHQAKEKNHEPKSPTTSYPPRPRSTP